MLAEIKTCEELKKMANYSCCGTLRFDGTYIVINSRMHKYCGKRYEIIRKYKYPNYTMYALNTDGKYTYWNEKWLTIVRRGYRW